MSFLYFLLFQQIPAGGGEETAQYGKTAERLPQFAGVQVEFGFVVRIDEPQLAVGNPVVLAGQFLELLDGGTCTTDVHQFVDATLGFTSQTEQSSIGYSWQQMDEGQVGKQGMMANLLVATEGHLPGRKGDKKEAAGRQEMLDSGEQLPFVCNVLDDVVHQDKVEGLFCHWCILQDVGSEESTFCFGLTEETTCLFNTRGSQVDACHPATGLCERQKVATFAASYFQYTSLGRDADKRLHIGNVVKAAGLYLLAEVEFSVLMSLLHVVLGFDDAAKLRANLWQTKRNG